MDKKSKEIKKEVYISLIKNTELDRKTRNKSEVY